MLSGGERSEHLAGCYADADAAPTAAPAVAPAALRFELHPRRRGRAQLRAWRRARRGAHSALSCAQVKRDALQVAWTAPSLELGGRRARAWRPRRAARRRAALLRQPPPGESLSLSAQAALARPRHPPPVQPRCSRRAAGRYRWPRRPRAKLTVRHAAGWRRHAGGSTRLAVAEAAACYGVTADVQAVVSAVSEGSHVNKLSVTHGLSAAAQATPLAGAACFRVV